jgi:hypothetical protein
VIEHIRHRTRMPTGDNEFVWAVQLYRSRDPLQWFLPLLRQHYPHSRVVLIVDGDGERYDDIAEAHGCQLVYGDHWMTLPHTQQYVQRLLRHLLDGPELYLFRIDPDARVWRRFSELPAFSSVFGTLETISEGYRDEILTPANVQGGCLGLTHDAASEILSSGVLTHESCASNFRQTWARCRDQVSAAETGLFCDDFVLSWAAHQLAIPIVEAREIRSRWRRPVHNEDLRYAITHPHKRGREE